MTRPALALVNLETGELAPNGRLPDNPDAQKLEELTEENEGLRKSLRSLNAQLRQARHELNELLDDIAPDEEWQAWAAWWCSYTGRGKRTKLDAGTDRAKHYKRLRKRFTQREVALMVVGARHHHFPPFRDRDEPEDFAKSLKWAEVCLKLGEARVPPKEDAA